MCNLHLAEASRKKRFGFIASRTSPKTVTVAGVLIEQIGFLVSHTPDPETIALPRAESLTRPPQQSIVG